MGWEWAIAKNLGECRIKYFLLSDSIQGWEMLIMRQTTLAMCGIYASNVTAASPMDRVLQPPLPYNEEVAYLDFRFSIRNLPIIKIQMIVLFSTIRALA